MLEFDLSLEEIPVKFKSQDGTEYECVLREMTGEVRDAYLQGMMGRMDMGAAGGPRMKNVKDVQATLIALCLFKENKQVPVDEIKRFPARVQKALHEKCQEMNGLTEAAAAAKKD